MNYYLIELLVVIDGTLDLIKFVYVDLTITVL